MNSVPAGNTDPSNSTAPSDNTAPSHNTAPSDNTVPSVGLLDGLGLPAALLAEPGTQGDHPLGRLREIVERARSRTDHARCDLCAAAIDPSHRHLVDIEDRTIRCACGPCFMLFDDAGAASGRYKQIPRRHVALRDVNIDAGMWDRLQIPVGLAFFFTNSSLGRQVAFYPGPAGATESLLGLEAWEELVDRNPTLGGAEPDVEALLVRRGDAGSECFVVPMDTCYELVGRLRTNWVGFDGGAEARGELDGFFSRLGELTGV